MLTLLALLACSPSADTGDTGAPSSAWDEAFDWVAAEPHPCPAPVPDGDPLVELLAALELDLSVGIEERWLEVYGGYIEDDPARRSWFRPLEEDLTLVPCFAGNAATRADLAVDGDHPLTALVADAAWMIDLTPRVGGTLAVPEPEAPLLDALERVHGGDFDREAAAEGLDAVPLEVRRAAGRLLLAQAEAAAARDAALASIAPDLPADELWLRLPSTFVPSTVSALDADVPAELAVLAPEAGPYTDLVEGGLRLAQALDEIDLGSLAGLGGGFAWSAETPLGAVVLRGTGPDTYDPSSDPLLDGPVALVIDTGGDDEVRYPAGATTPSSPAAVHLDLGGDDLYAYVEEPSAHDVDGVLVSDAGGRYAGDDYWGPISLSTTPRHGAGVLGYGFLLDLGGGRDTYRSPRFSMGYAALGVGVLWDDGGDDAYEGEAMVQGATAVGVGILADLGGADTYRAFQGAQGHARTGASGLLYDASGGDRYELVVDDPQLYNWYEGFDKNLSVGQGAAMGSRSGDYRTEVALSGGFALLRDRAGDDHYRASVMAQGEGYWFGLGVLADADGHDRYEGVDYVQASTQHFALAVLLEGGGDDVYNDWDDGYTHSHTSVGAAHDFSVSVLVDDGGSDTYFGPTRSMGASMCHGLGLLVENAGDERYVAEDDRAIGWATDWDWAEGGCGRSNLVPTYGLFVDAGGTDTYDKPDPTGYGDDTLWITDDPVDEDALELSGGIDTSTGPGFARAYGAVYEAGG